VCRGVTLYCHSLVFDLIDIQASGRQKIRRKSAGVWFSPDLLAESPWTAAFKGSKSLGRL